MVAGPALGMQGYIPGRRTLYHSQEYHVCQRLVIKESARVYIGLPNCTFINMDMYVFTYLSVL